MRHVSAAGEDIRDETEHTICPGCDTSYEASYVQEHCRIVTDPNGAVWWVCSNACAERLRWEPGYGPEDFKRDAEFARWMAMARPSTFSDLWYDFEEATRTPTPARNQSVECLNCGHSGLVTCEDDACPECGAESLTWSDPDPDVAP